MNEVLKNIHSRRSVRSYTADPLPNEIINEMLKAGVRAPNGMNVQPLRFVVVADRKALLHYSSVAKARFSADLQGRLEANPPGAEQLKHLKKMMDDPSFDIFYGAPCLIMIFSAPNALTPTEDGVLCAGNMMLAAHSLGVGSCWIGFASPLGEDPGILKELEVPDGHRLIAPLIFGYPKKADGMATPRNDPVILSWVKDQ